MPPALIQVVHTATIFTRVATDIVVLNSACGSPLPLHGAWEWFDGCLFEAMARAAAAGGPGGSWAALLRGDAMLIELFEKLRPIALATEHEAESKAAHAQGQGQGQQAPALREGGATAARCVREAAARWRSSLAKAAGVPR